MKFGNWSEKNEGMGFVQKLDKINQKDTEKANQNDSKDINKAAKMLIKGVQKKINDYWKKEYPSLKPDLLDIKKGKRYIKIIKGVNVGGKMEQRSVFLFIDAKKGNTYGDILKVASYKAPAKHARGNVFDGNWGVGSVGVYGPAYLR